jgi:uncharacterized protein YdeI (YjbR/CyaY-like superfamily)
MTKTGLNPKVDAYLARAKKWREELTKLRSLILDCGLTEELKWGKPCYVFQKSNIVVMVPLKETCALLFCKGVLLKDPKGVLTKAGENAQSARWMKFTSVPEIVQRKAVLKACIHEAIAAEKAGLKVPHKQTSDFAVAPEFKTRLDETPALKTAFAALTPGRQRGYLLYFSGAKQSKTRESRVAKCMPCILKGKGLDD